jgi:hypothetical protein
MQAKMATSGQKHTLQNPMRKNVNGASEEGERNGVQVYDI